MDIVYHIYKGKSIASKSIKYVIAFLFNEVEYDMMNKQSTFERKVNERENKVYQRFKS